MTKKPKPNKQKNKLKPQKQSKKTIKQTKKAKAQTFTPPFGGQKILSATLNSIWAGCIPPKSLILVFAVAGSRLTHEGQGHTASSAFCVISKE